MKSKNLKEFSNSHFLTNGFVGRKQRSDIAATPPFVDLLFSNYQLSIVNCQFENYHSSQAPRERMTSRELNESPASICLESFGSNCDSANKTQSRTFNATTIVSGSIYVFFIFVLFYICPLGKNPRELYLTIILVQLLSVSTILDTVLHDDNLVINDILAVLHHFCTIDVAVCIQCENACRFVIKTNHNTRICFVRQL